MTDEQRAIAAFYTKGGTVKRVGRSKRTMNEGQMQQALRGCNTHVSPNEERAILRQADYRKSRYG